MTDPVKQSPGQSGEAANSPGGGTAGPDERAYRRVINAWSMYDWANSGFATTILAAVLPVYYSQVAGANLPGNLATVYWGYTAAAALLVAALLAPVLGAIADFSGAKKRFLLLFTALGILFTAALYFVKTGDWLLASLIFIVSHIGFSGADNFYNSLLPHVARPEDMDRVSARGYALGYLGGGLLLGINVAMIQWMADGGLAARLSFVSVAIWWAIFTLPLIRHVPEPPPVGSHQQPISPFTAGFRRLGDTFHELRRYRQLLFFLIAFWIYNDGIGTIIKLAAIYGAEIGIAESHLIGALLVTQFVGIPFALAFGWLAGHLGAKRSLYLGLAVYTLISVAGYFVTTALHFWILALLVGTVQGGTQALSRSLFGIMTPRAKAAEFFGFYGMSSKFAGIVGPLIFALVGQLTGSSRLSIISLVIFFITGGLLLRLVDEREGTRLAQLEDTASMTG